MNQGRRNTISNNDMYYSIPSLNPSQRGGYNQLIDLSTTFNPELSSLWNGFNTDSNYHLRHFSENDVFYHSDNGTLDKQRNLQFDVVLEAATAITRKSEDMPITYLNRGQLYAIQLDDSQVSKKTMISTLSIEFHTPTHRRLSDTHWSFWISQQKNPNPQVIEIDTKESIGISDIDVSSFDKISFKWHGRYGAKVFVRFKCLSTDFSRTKGVKGVPLRLQMVTKEVENTMIEKSFCRIKLFRDKGAERKNKDDAKQISKQQEKRFGEVNDQSLSLLYNASIPFSAFQRLSESTSVDYILKDDLGLQSTKKSARYHTRIMTAPTSSVYNTSVSASDANASGLNYNSVSIDQTSLVNNTNAMDALLYQPILHTPALSEPDIFCSTLPFIDDTQGQTPNEILYTPIPAMMYDNNNNYLDVISSSGGGHDDQIPAAAYNPLTSNFDYFFHDRLSDNNSNSLLNVSPFITSQFQKHGMNQMNDEQQQQHQETYSVDPSSSLSNLFQ